MGLGISRYIVATLYIFGDFDRGFTVLPGKCSLAPGPGRIQRMDERRGLPHGRGNFSGLHCIHSFRGTLVAQIDCLLDFLAEQIFYLIFTILLSIFSQ